MQEKKIGTLFGFGSVASGSDVVATLALSAIALLAVALPTVILIWIFC